MLIPSISIFSDFIYVPVFTLPIPNISFYLYPFPFIGSLLCFPISLEITVYKVIAFSSLIPKSVLKLNSTDFHLPHSQTRSKSVFVFASQNLVNCLQFFAALNCHYNLQAYWIKRHITRSVMIKILRFFSMFYSSSDVYIPSPEIYFHQANFRLDFCSYLFFGLVRRLETSLSTRQIKIIPAELLNTDVIICLYSHWKCGLNPSFALEIAWNELKYRIFGWK